MGKLIDNRITDDVEVIERYIMDNSDGLASDTNLIVCAIEYGELDYSSLGFDHIPSNIELATLLIREGVKRVINLANTDRQLAC